MGYIKPMTRILFIHSFFLFTILSAFDDSSIIIAGSENDINTEVSSLSTIHDQELSRDDYITLESPNYYGLGGSGGAGTGRGLGFYANENFTITSIGIHANLTFMSHNVEIFSSSTGSDVVDLLYSVSDSVGNGDYGWNDIVFPDSFSFVAGNYYVLNWSGVVSNWVSQLDYYYDNGLPFDVGPLTMLDGCEGSDPSFGNSLHCLFRMGTTPPVSGCTDPYAENYNENATVDDGSCTGYPDNGDYSLSFDGVDDYTNAEWTSNMDTYTASMWVKSNVEEQELFHGFFNSYDDQSYGFQLDCNGSNQYRFYSDMGSVVFAPLSTEWSHIAIVADNSTTSFYFNGDLVTVKDWVMNEWNQIELGRNRSTAQPGNYTLDQVIIWNSARSQTEIQQDMVQELTGDEDGLLVYWKGDAGEGDILYDHTGNANHATIYGASWSENNPTWSDISIYPDSLEQYIVTGDSATQVLTIYNNGDADLDWSIEGSSISNRFEPRYISGSSDGPATSSDPINGNNFNDSGYDFEPMEMSRSHNGKIIVTGTTMFHGAKNFGSDPDHGALNLVYNSLNYCSGESGTIGCYPVGGTASGYLNDLQTNLNTAFDTDYTLVPVDINTDLVDVDGEPLYDVLAIGYNWNTTIVHSQEEITEYFEAGGSLVMSGSNYNGEISFLPFSVTNQSYSLNTFPGPALDQDHPLAQNVNYGEWGYSSELHSIISAYDEDKFHAVWSEGVTCVIVHGGNLPDWFSLSDTSGTIAPGASQNIEVLFNASELDTGFYETEFFIVSNDPDESAIEVPVYLEVDMLYPDILVLPDHISEELYIGDSSNQTLTIYNNGEADLNWSSLITSSSRTHGPRSHLVSQLLNESNTNSFISVEEAVSRINERARSSEHNYNDMSNRPIIRAENEYLRSSSSSVSRTVYNDRNSRSLDVAILMADYIGWGEDVLGKLIDTDQFNSVTLINVAVETPTIEELSAFNSVLVWSDYNFADATTLGNNLADYVDMGGGVVCAMFTVGQVRLSGRFYTDEYWVINPISSIGGTSSLGTIHEPDHPILNNVQSLDACGTCYRPSSNEIADGAIRVADWTDGAPFIVTREINGVHRADLGLFPPTSDSYSSGWDPASDVVLLMANTLTWVSGQAQSDWFSSSLDSGVIPPGSSQDILVDFNALDIESGLYSAEMLIMSNDPDQPEINIPIDLLVFTDISITEIPDTSIYEDTSLVMTIATDHEGYDYTLTASSDSSAVEVIIENDSLHLIPQQNWNGVTQISVVLILEDSFLDTTEFTLTVLSVNDAPNAYDDIYYTNEDDTLTTTLISDDGDPLDNESDEQSLTFTEVTSFGHGTFDLGRTTGMLTYIPNSDFFGADSFQYSVMDDGTTNGDPDPLSDIGMVVIHTLPINDDPLITDLSDTSMYEDSNLTIMVNATDIDNEDITIEAYCSDNDHVFIEFVDSALYIFSMENWHGSVTVTVVANDNMERAVDVEEFQLIVIPVNDAPFFSQTLNAVVGLDLEFSITLEGEDIDSEELAYSFLEGSIEPEWISIDGNLLNGVPTELGFYPLSLTLYDGDTTIVDTFELSVENFNPQVISVMDVPEDQGGRVYIDFNRSFFDHQDETGQFYTIYRHDEVNDTLVWVGVGTASANGNDAYTLEVSTLVDSTVNGEGLTEFKVVAFMNEGTFQSDMSVGYSLDNIAPSIPEGMAAVLDEDGVNISWNMSQEEDFQYFNLERSFSENFSQFETYTLMDTFYFDIDISEGQTTYYRTVAVDLSGNVSDHSDIVFATMLDIDAGMVPSIYALYQNYPNPFNPVTSINYDLPEDTDVMIRIYDIQGRLINRLVTEYQTAGRRSVLWDATNQIGEQVSAGMYFYLIEAGNFKQTRKMLLLK